MCRWRRDIHRRLDDLEVALGAGSPKDSSGQEQPGSFHGLVARVDSLESLSRLTLVRTCHQLYTMGIRLVINISIIIIVIIIMVLQAVWRVLG